MTRGRRKRRKKMINRRPSEITSPWRPRHHLSKWQRKRTVVIRRGTDLSTPLGRSCLFYNSPSPCRRRKSTGRYASRVSEFEPEKWRENDSVGMERDALLKEFVQKKAQKERGIFREKAKPEVKEVICVLEEVFWREIIVPND